MTIEGHFELIPRVNHNISQKYKLEIEHNHVMVT